MLKIKKMKLIIILIFFIFIAFVVNFVYAKNYAVLISTQDVIVDDKIRHSEYWYDLFLMYEVLYENGFTHSNIHVLYGNGSDFQSSHARYQIPSAWGISQITDRSNSESDVEDTFSDLSSIITNKDFLFVWWMGHGEIDGSCPDIYFWIENTEEIVYDHEFKNYVDQISNYKRRSFSIMTCYSGGIIDELKNNKTVILTSVPCSKKCYSDLYDVYHAEFTYNLFCALNWETPGGSTAVDADDNDNGLVSMYEAWDYTYDNKTYDSENERWRSYPQYSDLGSLGSNMYIFCCGELVRDIHILDDIDFTGDVIVVHGGDYYYTLTIDPGVTVTFSANNDDKSTGRSSTLAELTVLGILLADSVTFTSNNTTSQDWYGIVFDDAVNNSYIKDCTVEYGVIGVLCTNGSDINVEGNTFQYCSNQSVWIHESNPTIQKNLIKNGNRYGIYMSYSFPYIYNNKIQNNTNNYGIFYNWQSGGYLRHNTIKSNIGGIRCANTSSPNMIGKSANEPFGANEIIDNGLGQNWWGVCPSGGSYPNLGSTNDSTHYTAGRNSIYDNTSYQVKNLSSGAVWARRNYWEDIPPNNYGTVYYIGYTESQLNNVGALWKKTTNDADILKYLTEGQDYEGMKKLDEAIESYRWIVDNYPESEYAAFALARLMSCRNQQGNETLEEEFMNQLANQFEELSLGETASLWKPVISAKLDRRDETITLTHDLMASKAGTEMEKDLLYQLAMIYYYEFFDYEAARKTMDTFLEKFPDDIRSFDIKNLDFLFDYKPSIPKHEPKFTNKSKSKPKNFTLVQNYPNPFNSETIISYQLPEAGHITLVVYNLLGRKICTLVNKKHQEGLYTIHWDGKDENGSYVASGLYLYTMKVHDYYEMRKMVLLE